MQYLINFDSTDERGGLDGLHFKAPFTTSKTWGTYEQKDDRATLTLSHGTLVLNQLDIGLFKGRQPKTTLNGKDLITPTPNADSGILLRGEMKSQCKIWCWPIGSGEVYGYRMDQNMPPEVLARSIRRNRGA